MTKKQAAYRSVNCRSTIGAVSDAFAAIEELAAECREVADNLETGGFGETQRCVSMQEAADNLESAGSEPDIPQILLDAAISYSEDVPTRKGRAPSRAVRCANAAAILRAASDGADEVISNIDQFSIDSEEDTAEIQQFIDEVSQAADYLDNCAFPGMFG